MSVIEAMTNEGVLFVDKRDSWLMRAVGAIVGPWFMSSFVTTVRFPGCRCRAYLPSSLPDPRRVHDWLLTHERHHVWQFAPWYGPWLMAWRFMTPGGRWMIERRAMLADVRAGVRTYTQAVVLFRHRYRWPYPLSWMPRADTMIDWMGEHYHDRQSAW